MWALVEIPETEGADPVMFALKKDEEGWYVQAVENNGQWWLPRIELHTDTIDGLMGDLRCLLITLKRSGQAIILRPGIHKRPDRAGKEPKE
jgi:hypothetical protein